MRPVAHATTAHSATRDDSIDMKNKLSSNATLCMPLDTRLSLPSTRQAQSSLVKAGKAKKIKSQFLRMKPREE